MRAFAECLTKPNFGCAARTVLPLAYHPCRAGAQRGGAIERWIGSNTDIQDQKAAEAALADLAATLEQRVESEAADLLKTQEALRQSQKMESIGNLTGGVAHDFNNLLQSSRQPAAAGRDSRRQRARRTRASATPWPASAAAPSWPAQLLAFGRRQPLEPKVVNIGRAVSGMDDMLRRALGDAIEVETVVSGGLWNTFIDPAMSRTPCSTWPSTRVTP
jgi:C4-dicarboxylate-specific signal transduction histidine kinase